MSKRHKITEALFQFLGFFSLASIVFIVFLLTQKLIQTSMPILWQTTILLDLKTPGVSAEEKFNFALTKLGLAPYRYKIFSRAALYEIYKAEQSEVWVPVKAKFQILYSQDRVDDLALNKLLRELKAADKLRTKFNWKFFINSDSRYAEIAGIGASIKGTLLLIGAALLISVPLAFILSIYLAEFALPSFIVKLVNLIIINLFSTPSVILGMLSLTLFPFEKSTPLLGGATLSFIMLPSLVMLIRQSLDSFPLHIREAAKAMGASKIHILCEHILPYCFPQLIRGILITTSRIIGETAPLLIIGMVAFVPTLPANWSKPSTTLSTIIFLWSEAPEREFIPRAAAASLCLLLMVIILNLLANIFMRGNK